MEEVPVGTGFAGEENYIFDIDPYLTGFEAVEHHDFEYVATHARLQGGLKDLLYGTWIHYRKLPENRGKILSPWDSETFWLLCENRNISSAVILCEAYVACADPALGHRAPVGVCRLAYTNHHSPPHWSRILGHYFRADGTTCRNMAHACKSEFILRAYVPPNGFLFPKD